LLGNCGNSSRKDIWIAQPSLALFGVSASTNPKAPSKSSDAGLREGA